MESTIIPMSKRDPCGLFPTQSGSTAERALAKMARDGRIGKIGGPRNIRYMPVRR